MAHAGTMDLGGTALESKGTRRWPAVLLAAVVIGAMIAAIWLASSTGLGAAKIAADRSTDAAEAQRGAAVLSAANATAYDEYLDGILAGTHAAPYAGSAAQVYDTYLDSVLDGAHAAPFVVKRDRVGGQ